MKAKPCPTKLSTPNVENKERTRTDVKHFHVIAERREGEYHGGGAVVNTCIMWSGRGGGGGGGSTHGTGTLTHEHHSANTRRSGNCSQPCSNVDTKPKRSNYCETGTKSNGKYQSVHQNTNKLKLESEMKQKLLPVHTCH